MKLYKQFLGKKPISESYQSVMNAKTVQLKFYDSPKREYKRNIIINMMVIWIGVGFYFRPQVFPCWEPNSISNCKSLPINFAIFGSINCATWKQLDTLGRLCILSILTNQTRRSQSRAFIKLQICIIQPNSILQCPTIQYITHIVCQLLSESVTFTFSEKMATATKKCHGLAEEQHAL